MIIDHEISITVLLTAAVASAASLAGTSCSTVAEPSEDEPPVCEFCDIGEQELHCQISAHLNGSHFQHISDSAYICISPDTNDEDKEQACIDACEAHISDHAVPDVYCHFYDEDEPFFWSGCVPPEDPTGDGAPGITCPSWYSPSARVSSYAETSGVATVTIDRDFVLDIRSDMFSLYVCDPGRYRESSSTWVFENIESGDLLYELGIRDNDGNAMVQGFDPQTTQTTTSIYLLNSAQRMQDAYLALLDADGVKLTVERSGAPGGSFVIWITID